MYIASFKLENYKSFRSTPETPLAPGFNVIVGQNNVGKTALVEALSLTFAQRQHRSVQTVPGRNTPVTGASTVTVLLHLSRDEVFQFLARLGNFYVPVLGGAARPVEEAAQVLMAAISDANTLKTVWQDGSVVQARFVGLPVEPIASSFYVMRVTSGTIEPVQGGLIGTGDDARFER